MPKSPRQKRRDQRFGLPPRPGSFRRPGGPCGKIGHASRSEAKAALKNLRASGVARESPLELQIYYCEPCSAWHLGHGRDARPRRLMA